MLQKNIIKDFIAKFIVLEGKKADIRIKHFLYGNQKLNRCVLHPFVDEGRIGLIIEDEEKYITMEELRGIGTGNNQYVIKSDVMELYINL